jgi:hypothetical protein
LWLLIAPTETEHYLPIHRDAPALVDLATGQEILATGIKVDHLPTSALYPQVTCVVFHVLSSFFIRLLISLLLTKEEERLGFLAVLVLGKQCSLWN